MRTASLAKMMIGVDDVVVEGVEAVSNKIRLTVRMAYGFRNIDNLFSMVMPRCSDLRVELPGRAA